MRGTTDMTGVKENSGFELLPEGTYIFNIEDVEDKITQNGDPMILVTYCVAVGDHAGRRTWDNIIFPELNSPAIKIKGRTMHFLHCIDEPYQDKINWNSEMWKGKAVSIRIYHEEYNGKIRAKVAEYILDEESQEVVDNQTVPF